ncbi:MAG: hypothetical protein ACLRFI_02995 [Alphaproteobacteria bacterium]
MFKAIKDNKIIAISDTDSEFFCLVKDSVESDPEHTTADYDQYNGEYLLKSEIPLPTNAEQQEKRAEAYLIEVDPITAHINRLKDEEQTEEIVAEIEQLKTERKHKITNIKSLYPYTK